jgi:hypothetical protein
VLSQTATIRRRIERELVDGVAGSERYVDMGVRLVVVRAAPSGETYIDGQPPMVSLRVHTFGGLVDTTARAYCGPSPRPTVWLCSEDQERVLLHDDDATPGQLVYGSEGAGKTRTLAMWLALRVLRHVGEGREYGLTAPTEKRLEISQRELVAIMPDAWYRYRKSDKRFEFVDGSRIQLVSTHRQSDAQGSPIQGYNWSAAARDEGQDQIEVHADIEARGRSAPGGVYHQLITATAKDDTAWRTLRDTLTASGYWTRQTLLGAHSPFVWPDHWERMRSSMSEREYKRRVLAEDVGPERQVYTSWSRDNLRPVSPMAQDVTARELAPWGANMVALVGHDPGTLVDVSLVLKAYAVGGQVHWYVVDELTTEQTTAEQHVLELLRVMRSAYSANLLDSFGRAALGNRFMVRADPYGQTDNRTDRSVYTIFRNHGITIHPAAYSAEGTTPGRVPKEAGIDMVNTLLCNAAGVRRLFIATDDRGRPKAPRLLEALESSERNAEGKAEAQKKDKHDRSHWPAALRYALWAIERPRLAAIGRAA